MGAYGAPAVADCNRTRFRLLSGIGRSFRGPRRAFAFRFTRFDRLFDYPKAALLQSTPVLRQSPVGVHLSFFALNLDTPFRFRLGYAVFDLPLVELGQTLKLGKVEFSPLRNEAGLGGPGALMAET